MDGLTRREFIQAATALTVVGTLAKDTMSEAATEELVLDSNEMLECRKAAEITVTVDDRRVGLKFPLTVPEGTLLSKEFFVDWSTEKLWPKGAAPIFKVTLNGFEPCADAPLSNGDVIALIPMRVGFLEAKLDKGKELAEWVKALRPASQELAITEG